MPKALRKVLSVVLVAVMMLTAAPLSGFVGLELPNIFDIFASAETYSGTCGDNLKWTFNEETGNLVVYGTGEMFDYFEHYEYPWFKYDDKVKSIVIGEGVTAVGKGAFHGFKNLVSVTIPDSVTSIGDSTFDYCIKLNNITIPDSVTSIGSQAFWGCTGLKSIVIPKSVTSIGQSAFYGCTSLSSIIISDSVRNIGSGAFYNTAYYNDDLNWQDQILYINNHLVSVIKNDILGSCTVRNGTKTIAEGSFSDCEGLTEITLPDSITNIGEFAFGGCVNLSEVKLPKSLTEVSDYMFCDCTNLISVTIPEGVTSIGNGAFVNCDKFNSITIPSSIKTIGEGVFEKSLYAEKSNWDVYYLGNITGWCAISLLGSIAPNNMQYGSDRYSSNLHINGLIVNEVIIPDNVSFIGDYTFCCFNSVKKITIPDSVTTIGEFAFAGTGITSMEIPESVTSIGDSTFDYCIKLNNITIPDSVTSIGSRAFDCCFELEKITIPDSVTSIGEYAFNKCKSMTKVKLPKSLAEVSDAMFYDCESLTSIAIPEGVTSIGNSVFAYCDSLKTVELPDSVTNIGSNVFEWCNSLTSITFPNGITRISHGMFDYCNFTSFIIPKSVNSIGGFAFRSCTRLENITIPDSVTSIERNAFDNCRVLEDVYYSGTEEQWNQIVVDKDNDALLNATIHFNSTGGGSGGDADDGDYLYHLYAFSSKPQLIMGTVDAIELTFEIDCYDWENPAYLLPSPTFSFTASDTNIFSIEKIENRNGRTYVTITGENPGTAFLVVTGYNNGKYVAGGRYMVTVTGETVYHADAIPKFDDYNIIANSIIIDNYKCTNTGTETCNISFDAYNTLNCFGSVELYDSNNNLLESYCIDRFDLGLPTGLWDTVKQAFDVSDLKDRTYKNEEYSTKTEIELIAVPRDGHIVISNDPSASTVCAAYNLSYLVADICCEAVSLAMPSGSADEVSDNIAKVIAKETIETLFGNKAMLKKFESFTKDFLTGANCGSRESVDENVKFYSVFLSEIGVDIGDIAIEVFKESLKDLPGDLIETAVYSVFGAAGAIMKTGFKFISFADTADMIETLSENYGVGNTSIYCSKPWEEQLYSNGYMVTNRELFDENVSFHQYKIVDDDTYDKATNTFGDERYIDIIEMSLYKNGVKQQPQGDVEVAMPLPKGMSFMDVEVYRMEEDGSYTEIPCWVEDGYIYIKTNHFSVYCIVGEKIEIEDMSFEEDYVRLNLNDSHTNNLVIYPVESVNAELEWSSSDESIAVVTPMGNVVGINPGTVVIYASTKDGKHTASYTLEVVASISMYLNTSNISMNYKSSTTLVPSIDADAGVEYTVEYFSSDPSVATVDENGKVIATGTGSAEITVTVTDKNGNTVSDTCEVTVEYSWLQWIIVIVLFGWIWY